MKTYNPQEQDSNATPGSMSQPTPGSGGGGDVQGGPGSIKTEANIKEEPNDPADLAEKIKQEQQQQQQKQQNGTLDGLGGPGGYFKWG